MPNIFKFIGGGAWHEGCQSMSVIPLVLRRRMSNRAAPVIDDQAIVEEAAPEAAAEAAAEAATVPEAAPGANTNDDTEYGYGLADFFDRMNGRTPISPSTSNSTYKFPGKGNRLGSATEA